MSCPTLCDPMGCSIPGFPVLHHLLEFAHTHVHRVGDGIPSSHPLSSPYPLTLNFSQHQGLFQWVRSSHQVAKVLEFQLQHQSFQWIFRTDFLQDGLVWSPYYTRDSQEACGHTESCRNAGTGSKVQCQIMLNCMYYVKAENPLGDLGPWTIPEDTSLTKAMRSVLQRRTRYLREA